MKQPTTDTIIDNANIQSPAGQRLGEPWLRAARVGWIILAVLAVIILLTSLPGYALKFNGQLSHAPTGTSSTGASLMAAASGMASLATALLSMALSWLLFRRKFEETAAAALSFYLLFYAILMSGPLEFWSAYWLGSLEFAWLLQGILLATPTVTLLGLFPNGRFVPAWMRLVVLASLPWNLALFFLPSYTLATFQQHPLLMAFIIINFLGVYSLSIYAQVHRYRRISTAAERQQTKWVLFGFVGWIGYMLLSSIPFYYETSLLPGAAVPWWLPLSEVAWFLSLSIIPIVFTIAIMRHRLWNIDLVINRTLVYGALTFTTIALYILVVGALGSLMQVGDRSLVAFLTTGLVAVLFQPLRERLQGWVNRLMYGERDDPVAVLTRLGEQLEGTGSPDDALAGIAETVARALKLPYVGIELGQVGEIAAAYGLPPEGITRLPLTYQSEITGYLLVSSRSPDEAFSTSDIRLLENISHQAGAAAHAAKLTADLRHSRQRLVTAREEERRRLRRDLHDGLGPTLATLTLKLDTLRNLMKNNPAKAESLIGELKTQIQETIRDIRNLVYELRPPALDELGLAGAIRSFIDGKFPHHPRISLEIPEELPPLPAAFEVAIYRITLEALTNIERHANADHGAIRITKQEGQLILAISDDGDGLPEGYRAGVGFASMRERAEELGGTFELLHQAKGLHFRARLPLPQE